MKRIILLAVCALSLLATIPAQAQIRMGVKAGANLSNFNYKDIKGAAGKVTGFTGGMMIEAIVPIIGIGAEASVMYSRTGGEVPTGIDKFDMFKTDNVEIPINLKYKIGIPYVGKLFVIAGPSFKFKLDDNFPESIENKTNYDLCINAGGGLELFNKFQLAAQYGWGITGNELEVKLDPTNPANYMPKERYWTFTAAYLF